MKELAKFDPECVEPPPEAPKRETAASPGAAEEPKKDESAQLRDAANKNATQRARAELDNYLADVFGMYIMGPSYACAAIHMMLMPPAPEMAAPGRIHDRALAGDIQDLLRRVPEDQLREELQRLLSEVQPADTAHRFDHERARVIFRALDRMMEEVGSGNEYNQVHRQLADIWESMLAAADPGWNDPKKKDLRERKFPSLDRITAEAWTFFKQRFVAEKAHFPHEHPRRSTGWRFARKLGLEWATSLDGDLAVPQLPDDSSSNAAPKTDPGPAPERKILDYDTSVRDALCAGWVCRRVHADNLRDRKILPLKDQGAGATRLDIKSRVCPRLVEST